ncbi:putative serine/Threonine protein kinases, catalytic domain [Lyophyllum shimeji]|uniref:Serine/Threonine protein kinases, catalytic domain n=1 Tax=Lyophyllum shimeji TaxID=47721 RepID=A0A9P3PIA0_LYOSH|nr:putative serine/Threonine protein kinases, catalytic domain [Lyophyllum shimeji]
MSSSSPKFIGAVEDEWQLFSDRESDYKIGSPIGFGASSIVYAATYQPPPPHPGAPLPPPIPCALKVLDLDALPPRSLALLQRETTLMSLSKHPNVLRVRGSWMNGHKLYIALRLMNKGSAADVMRYGWPGGMEEEVVRCILRQALQGLNYLHINGFIHRDIKAANLLIDDDGTVLLGDLGVAADLSEDTTQRLPTSKTHRASASAVLAQSDSHASHSSGSSIGNSGASKRVVLFDHTVPVVERPKMGKRKSFVGTPCWMAPELIEGRHYDSSADIWSFGITALELSQGRPPKSRETTQRVLMRTIQDEPPTLDREGGTYKYTRAFKEMVDSCLVKDPSKRPTAQELLQTPFFKGAKKKSYLVGAILKDLPPLAQRQERRVTKNTQTMHSLDSWDFATTTLHSPTPSLHQRRAFESINLAESSQDDEGVFEMEEGTNGDVKQDSNKERSSEEVSWSRDNDNANEHEASDIDPSLSSSSPSSSELSSGPPHTSPPSSLASSCSPPPPAIGSDTVVERPSAHEHKKTLSEKVPIKPSGSQLANQASSITSSSPSSSFLSSSSLASSPRKSLWHRVKSNVRRTGSRDLDEGEKGRTSPPSAKKEKSGRWRGSLLG